MFDNKLWLIVASEDNESLKYFTQHITGDTAAAFSMIRIIMVEKLVASMDDHGQFHLFYDGQPMNPPMMFWPAVTNSDAFLLEQILLGMGSKSIVDFEENRLMRSKILVHQRMAEAGVPMPVTNVFSKGADIASVTRNLQYPFVVKPDNGQGGYGVEMIHTEAELVDYMSKMRSDDMSLAQEFVSSSSGRSYRITTLNGKFFFGVLLHATKEGEFRSNGHLGGTFVEWNPDPLAIELGEKAVSPFKLPLLGVDLFKTDDGYMVNEINSFPGIVFAKHVTTAFNALLKPLMAGN